ncbi:MAG: hypothetical protein Kow0098_28280 [Ignavibacteriaceae bacterium]
MKTFIFIFSLMLLPALTHPQELYEIIDYHFDAVKQDKYNKLSGLVLTYEFKNNGETGKMIIFRKRNNKLRIEKITASDTIITIYNNGEAYRKTGSDSVIQKIDGREFEELKFAADMDGYFFCYREKEHKLELKGKEKLGNRDVFKIICVKPGGYEAVLYMDVQKYLLLETIHRFPEDDKIVEKHTRFENYKSVDGIPFPFREIVTINNETETRNLLDVKLNLVPEDLLFIP